MSRRYRVLYQWFPEKGPLVYHVQKWMGFRWFGWWIDVSSHCTKERALHALDLEAYPGKAQRITPQVIMEIEVNGSTQVPHS